MIFKLNDRAVNFELDNSQVDFTLNDRAINFKLNIAFTAETFYRLLETGFVRLLENGSRRLLE